MEVKVMAVVLKITTKEARAIIQKIQVMIDNKVNVLKRSVKVIRLKGL